MNVKVLGAGCKSCEMLYKNVKNAVKKLEGDIEVEYITDMKKIIRFGVMKMPCIVVDEKVVSQGKILSEMEIESLLTK